MILLPLCVFLLAAAGIYLLLGRRLFQAILGLSLLAHAANLTVLAGAWRKGTLPALHGGGLGAEQMADPLPQALVLTAIVISMALTLYLLGLWAATRTDEEERG